MGCGHSKLVSLDAGHSTKEFELYVTTELRKPPKTASFSQVFKILAFEHFLDVFSAWR